MIFGSPKPLTLAQQYINLRSNPVSAGEGRVRAGRLTWRYATSPSPLSRTYGVRIEVPHDLFPNVYVESPDLHLLADGRRLPHVYEQDPVRLCLYLPGTREWRRWMRIDQTMVPWTTLWLFYFEDWLASGEWKGGGRHPPEEGNSARRRSPSPPRGVQHD